MTEFKREVSDGRDVVRATGCEESGDNATFLDRRFILSWAESCYIWREMRTFFNWVHSLGYVLKGASAMRRGDQEGVIEHYTRAIEISPDDLEYYFARAQAYWHQKELGLAIADYTKVIDLNPANIHAQLNRGAAYVSKGYIAQALRDLNAVIAATDGLAYPHYLRAVCHAENKDYDLALADVELVLAMDPSDDNARKLADHVRGRIHLAEHRKSAS